MLNRLLDSLSTRKAKFRQKTQKSRVMRTLGGRGAATLAVGAMLAAGGVTDVMDRTHFVVRKDLDAVRVVRETGSHRQVVARLDDPFTANSVFKLSRILPDRFVTRQLALFDQAWMPQPARDDAPVSSAVAANQHGFRAEMARINESIRRDFFENAVPFGGLIHEKAAKYNVDPALVAAVVETESRFRPNARSHVGAQGLMQLMPRTGRWMGARNLYNPEQNIDAGAKYLSYLQDRFDGNIRKTIAAYNGGEGNVKRYNGVPPFRETRSYVAKVMTKYKKRQSEMKDFAKQRENPGGGEAVDADGVLAVR